MLLKQDITNLARKHFTEDYYISDFELTDALDEAFNQGKSIYKDCEITTIACDWIDEDDEDEGDVMAVVDIQCADGIQRLGYWSSNTDSVVEALGNGDTIESWAQAWLNDTDAETCPLLVQNQVFG